MTANHVDPICDPKTVRFYHGTRAALLPGELIEPGTSADDGRQGGTVACAYLSSNLDEAIWEAELAAGEGHGRVYVVVPTGEIGHAAELAGRKPAGHPAMSLCTREPLRVIGEVTQWRLYHGTRADLKPGELIKPGHAVNFGKLDRTSNYVYLSRTMDAATWAAELASGDRPGRIYVVQPTGPIEPDPNLTDTKFRGNPTQSYRSREPLLVLEEIAHWQGHAPAALKAVTDQLERLRQLNVEPLDD